MCPQVPAGDRMPRKQVPGKSLALAVSASFFLLSLPPTSHPPPAGCPPADFSESCYSASCTSPIVKTFFVLNEVAELIAGAPALPQRGHYFIIQRQTQPHGVQQSDSGGWQKQRKSMGSERPSLAQPSHRALRLCPIFLTNAEEEKEAYAGWNNYRQSDKVQRPLQTTTTYCHL